jgi:ferrous iron transport protein B
MTATAAPKRALLVALAGNPNCGKSTLFNALTGLRQKVANYPGVTVEKKTGRCRLASGDWADVTDLPGTYSLIPNSPDETVMTEVVRGLLPGEAEPDVIVAVVDANNLGRNLYLLSQLLELGKPVVVALNMMDVAKRNGITIDDGKLSAALGVTVVPVVACSGSGIEQLKGAIVEATTSEPPAWPLPEAMGNEVRRLRHVIGGGDGHSSAGSRHALIARRLLTSDPSADLAAVRADAAVASEVAAAQRRLSDLAIDPVKADIEGRYHWIDALVAQIVQVDRKAAGRSLSDRIDAVLMHRVFGLVIFVAVMAALFTSIFFLAEPIMAAIEAGRDALSSLVTGAMAEGPLRSLITDGVIAGVGNVVIFLPQIALLFLFLAVLEDSGYLARAAFIMDRVLAKVGLHGKSFIPLLSSFACAIPGIMATRTIGSWRERMATIFVAPFMSCSA